MTNDLLTPAQQLEESFTKGKPFTVSPARLASFTRLKKRFNCALCGKVFRVGDAARWIYANGTPGACIGNFFVCGQCDTGSNPELIQKAIASFAQAKALAQQWDIYGPDWERNYH